MINFDDITNENKIEHNSKWPKYSRSSIQNTNNRRFWIRRNKCIVKFNKESSDIDKINLYVKAPYGAKHQYLINKCEKAGFNHFNGPKAFI